MTKSVLKELIIVLLLCLAIILVLGILLYEYVPMSKTIPNQVAYTTPEEVKEELLSSGQVDESEIVMTYEINSDDLNNYKRIQDYKPGKANPFSSYETQVPTENAESANTSTGQANSGANSSSSNSSSSNGTIKENNQTTTSGGQFFQDKGTK